MSHDKTEPLERESGPDRRDHDRFRIKGAKVEHMKVEFLSFIDKDLRRKEDLLNVSEGGMLFSAGDTFPIGQNLSLVLHVPHTSESPKMRGEVVRATQPEGADHYHIGVKFTMCCSDAAEMLRSLARQSKETPDRVELYVDTSR